MTSPEAPARDVLLEAFASYPQPCVLSSIRGEVVLANGTAVALLGSGHDGADGDSSSIEGAIVADLIGADRAEFVRDLRIAASSPSTPLRYSVSGTPYSISVAVLRTASRPGAIRLLLTFSQGSVLRDQFADLRTKVQTANRQALEERRKRAEIAARYEQLQQFSYAAAHDLKAPLREIAGYMNIIVEDHSESIGDEAMDYIERATVSANQLSTLITDIMRYGATAGANLTLGDVEIGPVVDEMLLRRSASLLEAGATVEFDSSLGTVRADHKLLRRILANLIENAIKYRSDERPLKLCISATRDHLGRTQSLTLTDNGQGINPARADRLFEPFRRGHNGSVPGSGIGLATCKAACDLHGWSITATGARDEFASFTITFAPSPSGRRGPG